MKELFKYIIYVHEKKEYSSSSCDRYCVTVIKLITKPADFVITKESWNYARNYSLQKIIHFWKYNKYLMTCYKCKLIQQINHKKKTTKVSLLLNLLELSVMIVKHPFIFVISSQPLCYLNKLMKTNNAKGDFFC